MTEVTSPDGLAPLLLLGWSVPVVRQTYTRRDTALYSLSVGLGHDPLDSEQRALVDPWNPALQALPTMALILGYPGFWLGEPSVRERTGLTPADILHAEQSIELHRPLPPEATVLGETTVFALQDKGERGALLHSRRVIRDADSLEPIATLKQAHFLRNCGGCGSHGEWDVELSEPPDPVVHQVELSTRPEQALLYRLNGDANALHVDPGLAQRAGFPRPIFHGMGTVGVVGHALVRALCQYDPDRLTGLRLRMRAPVLPGDTLRIEIGASGAFRAWAVERNTPVIDNGHAIFH